MATEDRRGRNDAERYLRERERRLAYALAYAKANPTVGQRAKRRRRAALAGAGVFVVTERDWRRLCARYDFACCYCGCKTPLTMDHVIPVTRGGRHSIGNLLPACASCNPSKSNSTIMEWRLRRAKGGGSHPLEAERSRRDPDSGPSLPGLDDGVPGAA
jgi:5-methylcytosine-specific restriction endonuclease McrA